MTIVISQRTLTDNSHVYDVAFGNLSLAAITEKDAQALADKIECAINAHTTRQRKQSTITKAPPSHTIGHTMTNPFIEATKDLAYPNDTDELLRLRALNAELLSVLMIAEKSIDDCHQYRSHLHFTELDKIRAAIALAKGDTP